MPARRLIAQFRRSERCIWAQRPRVFETSVESLPPHCVCDFSLILRHVWSVLVVNASGVRSPRRCHYRSLDEGARSLRGECGGKPNIKGALHAFLDTDLDLYINGGEGWRNWGALGGQVTNTEWGAQLMDEHFDPEVLRLIGFLKQAMPDSPEEDIFWGYHFVTGGLLLTLAQTGRIDRLSNGVCSSDDFAAVKARMATFMTGGSV